MEKRQTGFEVRQSERQSWGSIAMIWVGSMVCVPSLMIGGLLSSGFTLGGVTLCILLGYSIVSVYMCFMGMQGCDTGLPTVPMSEAALGKKGAKFLIGMILTVSCIGWFGVQAAVCGASFSAMIGGMTGFAVPEWISSVFWGILMVLTAMYGYKALKILNYLAVPALAIVLVIGLWNAFTAFDGVNAIRGYQPAAPMSYVTGIGLVVASFAVAGVISADFCRYAKSRGDVIKSSFCGVMPAGLIVILTGAALSIVTGQYDITEVLAALGLPGFGLIALILATWTTNVANAYSGGLAVSNVLGFDEGKFKYTTGAAGLVGTVLGAAGILSNFQGFLGLLSSFIPPVAGVIMANYWIFAKGKRENFIPTEGVNLAGVVAFALGGATAYITAGVIPFFVAPINGIVVSMVGYLVLAKALPAKAAEDRAAA